MCFILSNYKKDIGVMTMEMWYIGLIVFVVLLGAITLAYQVYNMVYLDAKSRGLKHPKFWGFFSMSGNNGSGGLILYLLGRNKYVSSMSVEDRSIMEIRKKKALVSLCFIVVGTFSLIMTMVLNGF